MEVGLGGFYVMRPVRPLATYGGARIGMVFNGTNATQTATVSRSKFGAGREAMLFMLVYL
jgi:hypothetical protein